MVFVKKSKKFTQNFKAYLPLYLLALPAVVLMIVYRYVPMLGLAISFTDFSAGMSIDRVSFVGMKWFINLFSNADFSRALVNTLWISFLKLLIGFPAPIILAILMNEMSNMPMKRITQTLLYLPHFLSWTILAGIIFTLFSTQTGIVSFFGITESVLLNDNAFVAILIASDVWKTSGWGTIVYLAAITSISPELYEAAMIDGANRWKLMWNITLPSISGTIVVLLILRLGNVLNAGFDQIFVLQNDAVKDVSEILDTLVYTLGMSQGNFGLATAAGLFKSVVGFVLVLSVNMIAKKIDPESGIL